MIFAIEMDVAARGITFRVELQDIVQRFKGRRFEKPTRISPDGAGVLWSADPTKVEGCGLARNSIGARPRALTRSAGVSAWVRT